MTGILSGLRVVEGSAFVAAPLGGMTLAQMGADVIRFDPIGGGLDYKRWPVTKNGDSLFWAGLNKGKRSIAIDFRNPEGTALLQQLICAPGDEGGLFLTNFPPRGWLAYDKLKEGREDLIMVNVLGDRHGGSAVDYTVNPATGFTMVTGSEYDAEPVNHVLPAWDNIAGQMAAVGLLAAERHRRLTGEGQYVSLALADVALATAGNLGFIGEVEINKEERPKYGNYLYGAYGKDFVTRDGRRVMIIGLTGRQWKSIRETMGLGEAIDSLGSRIGLDLRDEGNRFRARDELSKLFAPWFAERSFDEVKQQLDAGGVCWGPYQTFKQLVEEDPECSTANPLFSEVEQPGIGTYKVPASPLNFAKADKPEPAPAPALGQHTDEILADVLGLDSGSIGKLHDAGVVAGPK